MGVSNPEPHFVGKSTKFSISAGNLCHFIVAKQGDEVVTSYFGAIVTLERRWAHS